MRIAGLVIALMVLAAAPARAEDYPTRPIRILVPYAPGGIADIAARLVGGKLTDAFGQQVIIENRPGGNGFIAVADAAKATPDGYTLVMVTTGDVAINPALFKDMPYDVERDLAPITAVSDAPVVLAANGGSPFKSVALNTGTKFVHVPYKGGAPAAQALVAGDVPLGVLASSSVAPYVPTGQIRVLAVSGAQRSAINPDWPTLKEQGAGDINASNWTALLAPRATPQPIIDKLYAKVVEILNMPDVKAKFAAGGVSTIPSSPAELSAKIKRELAVYRVIIEKANVHVD
jgi:tripartite-type tricarboxylate transporter receptor subunit TctC